MPKDIVKVIDLKVALDMLTAYLGSIPPTLIKNCFHHAGFIQDPVMQPTPDPGTWNLVHCLISYLHSTVMYFSLQVHLKLSGEMVTCTICFNIYIQRNNQTETSGTKFKMCYRTMAVLRNLH